jgi:hypothetical protein
MTDHPKGAWVTYCTVCNEEIVMHMDSGEDVAKMLYRMAEAALGAGYTESLEHFRDGGTLCNRCEGPAEAFVLMDTKSATKQ